MRCLKSFLPGLLLLLFVFPLSAQTSMANMPKVVYLGMSAALPGTGEIALGKTSRGAFMLSVDVLALTSFWATGRQKNDLTNSYKQYAQVYAGIPADMSDNYYQHIQQYISSDEFNQFQELMARNYYLIYTYDPAGFSEYIAANTYNTDEAWQWQTTQHQDHYKSLRRKTQQTKMYQNLSLGIIILNRVISVIDVALISRNPNPNTALYFSPLDSGGLMLNYQLEF